MGQNCGVVRTSRGTKKIIFANQCILKFCKQEFFCVVCDVMFQRLDDVNLLAYFAARTRSHSFLSYPSCHPSPSSPAPTNPHRQAPVMVPVPVPAREVLVMRPQCGAVASCTELSARLRRRRNERECECASAQVRVRRGECAGASANESQSEICS